MSSKAQKGILRAKEIKIANKDYTVKADENF